MNLTSFFIFWIISMALLAGLGMLLQTGTQAEIAKRRTLSHWPKTSGVVTGARVEETRSAFFLPGSSLHFYLPIIEYTYQIGGKFNRSGKWRTIYPKKAARIVAEYIPEKTIAVTFNPDNPAEAYLAPDSATITSWTWRVGGLALILAAGVILVRGTVLIFSDRASQEQVDRVPALLPVASLDLQSGLQSSLDLACKPDQPDFAGQSLTYIVWTCANPSDSGAPTVWFYSRQRAPEKVDYISAIPGGTSDMSKICASLASIARLTTQDASVQAVEDWVVATTPKMQNKGDQAQANVTDSFKSVRLEIGALQ